MNPNVHRYFKDLRLFSDYSLVLVRLVVGGKHEELTFIETEEVVVVEMIRTEQRASDAAGCQPGCENLSNQTCTD